jgi:hypothetical protein
MIDCTTARTYSLFVCLGTCRRRAMHYHQSHQDLLFFNLALQLQCIFQSGSCSGLVYCRFFMALLCNIDIRHVLAFLGMGMGIALCGIGARGLLWILPCLAGFDFHGRLGPAPIVPCLFSAVNCASRYQCWGPTLDLLRGPSSNSESRGLGASFASSSEGCRTTRPDSIGGHDEYDRNASGRAMELSDPPQVRHQVLTERLSNNLGSMSRCHGFVAFSNLFDEICRVGNFLWHPLDDSWPSKRC